MTSHGAPLTIVVGKDEREFHIGEDLICSKSEFFKAACPEEKLVSKMGRVITLDQEDPNIFTIFHKWLESGSIRHADTLLDLTLLNIISLMSNGSHNWNLPSLAIQSRWEAVLKRLDAQFYQLLDCYYFGVALQTECFQNYIMDRIVELLRWRDELTTKRLAKKHDILTATGTQIHQLYQRTSKDSPLRQLIDEYLLQEARCYDYVPRSINQDMGFNVRSSAFGTRATVFYEHSQCYFHVHRAEHEATVCTKTVL
jgi:hypothetical protein